MLDPDEVAQAAIYFLSDESRAVTGQLLKVDGGWSVTSVSPEPARDGRQRGRCRMTFIRTVLGDIDPSELGVTYAHEHLVIDGGRPVLMQPDFDLSDVDAMAIEVAEAAALGLGAAVDAMPCDAGRNAGKLAELSRRTGVHIVAPTGLHHDRYYGPAHWSHRLAVEELADLFAADITDGIDVHDYAGPVVRRTPLPCRGHQGRGFGEGGLARRDRRVMEAAAGAHRLTGAPILTHCEGGTGGGPAGPPARRAWRRAAAHRPEPCRQGGRSRLPPRARSRPARTPSTTARSAGATATTARSGSSSGPSRTAADDRILLGMDAARRGYYRVHGGSPG